MPLPVYGYIHTLMGLLSPSVGMSVYWGHQTRPTFRVYGVSVCRFTCTNKATTKKRCGGLGTYSRACSCQENGIERDCNVHICNMCLLFMHNKNLKYLGMTTITVIRRHNIHNNHNCITQNCARQTKLWQYCATEHIDCAVSQFLLRDHHTLWQALYSRAQWLVQGAAS
jgi:hypothetical protein